MKTKRGRLDRYLAKQLQLPRKQIRQLLLQGRVTVDGKPSTTMDRLIDEFSEVMLDGKVMQSSHPKYLMMHKPLGLICATKDDHHQTVLDLLPQSERAGLHIVGRLDRNTSGLVLLTNDSRWSRALMHPDAHVTKEYLVSLAHPLTDDYQAAFAAGMYFGFENVTTAPAQLTILDSHRASVILTEGKYHQIKRMFGRFRNPVVALHRTRIGGLKLDEQLVPGQWRELTPQEIKAAQHTQ